MVVLYPPADPSQVSTVKHSLCESHVECKAAADEHIWTDVDQCHSLQEDLSLCEPTVIIVLVAKQTHTHRWKTRVCVYNVPYIHVYIRYICMCGSAA